MKIDIVKGGFTTRRSFHSTLTLWNDVRQVYGELVGKVTYDECFLVFETKGSTVSCGELDEGFDVFERALFERFPTFPREWRNWVNAGGIGSRITLWTNS